MAKAKSNPQDDVRQYLESVGGAAAASLLDAEPLDVREVIQEGDDPFAFYGSAYRPDIMRYSWVPTEAAAERLKRQRFVHIDGDIHMRGISGGIIMGRLLKDEAVYRAARQKRDYERRTGRTSDIKRMGHGDPSKQGRFTMQAKNTPAQVRVDEMEG